MSTFGTERQMASIQARKRKREEMDRRRREQDLRKEDLRRRRASGRRPSERAPPALPAPHSDTLSTFQVRIRLDGEEVHDEDDKKRVMRA